MSKNKAFGISGKNEQQKEALNALLDASIDLVVLEGKAGSGKTLLALAAGLEQAIETKTYNNIIFTRAPVSVGADMGFLPGEIGDKMMPWCYGLFDNLEVLNVHPKDVERYITIAAMQHMRGRSFMRKYIIIDETQNITVPELKIILTRAGENTKIVCLGDKTQVDNKKLTSENNALSYLVRAANNCEFIKVVSLPEGVRSRLCNWAADNM